MLEEIQRWIAAGDSAINGMGPIAATVLAMLGASSLTQLLKFPLARLITSAAWLDWTIKMMACMLTWAMLRLLNRDMPHMLVLVLSVAQPYAYTAAMRVIRKYWPWLEATKVAGSAVPSEEAVAALVQRRSDRAGN